MIIYCRNLSPFGRRLMIWMTLQGRSYEQRPIQVVGDDFERLKTMHPGGRVPVLELDDGTRLVDSFAIQDYLETDAAPERRLLPAEPLARRDAMQLLAYGNAAMEKAVAFVYEKNRRPEEFQWADWQVRLAGQAIGALQVMEGRCPMGGFFGGDAPGAADIFAVVAYDFVAATNPDLLGHDFPKLAALSDRANALDAFERTHPKHS